MKLPLYSLICRKLSFRYVNCVNKCSNRSTSNGAEDIANHETKMNGALNGTSNGGTHPVSNGAADVESPPDASTIQVKSIKYTNIILYSLR